MRIAINLEEDLYRIAKAYAKETDTSISATVNRFLRRSMTSPQPPAATDASTGVPTVRGRKIVTSEEVYGIDLEDETTA
jgi:hypothetical protein